MSNSPYTDTIIGEEPEESCPYIDEIILNVKKAFHDGKEIDLSTLEKTVFRHLEKVRKINFNLREQRNTAAEVLENISTEVNLTDYF